MNFDYSPPDTNEPTENVLLKERRVGYFAALENALRAFTPGERLTLYVLSIVLVLSVLAILAGLNSVFTVTVPSQGGTLVEAEIAPARFINPVLALSQADQDLTELVYSGLMRANPDGTYSGDLASSYEISSDGTTYTFHMRPNATFQDGTPVTSADVVFTIQEIQDPDLKSPQAANWQGVTVSAPDAHTVVFTLPHPYAPFIEDATIGILPEHVWQNISAEEFPFSPANTRPIGSGPYRVSNVTTDDTGSPTRYDLVPFDKYVLGPALISKITFNFYTDENAEIAALNSGAVDAIADVAPEDLANVKRGNLDIIRSPLPRVYGIFFNQTHDPALADSAARQALDAAVDKQAIVSSVLSGYGVVLNGPIPPNVSGDIVPATPVPFTKAPQLSATTTPNASDVQTARGILQSGGWSFNSSSNTWTKNKQTLSVTLATADEPELVSTANDVAADWRAVGVQVQVQVYPLSELNINVIRPRSYDAVLFGYAVGRSLDLFAFWDSSQRTDPGLNLAMYANATVDKLLDQARATTDVGARDQLYAQFATQIQKDDPAVFLYSPDFIYLVPNSLSGVQIGALTTPAERYLNVYRWYDETDHVWSLFSNS